MFEVTQYSPVPLGSVSVIHTMSSGIIQVIICCCCCCCAVIEGVAVILCWTYVDTPTSSGSANVLSGLPRFSQRKCCSSGTCADRNEKGYSRCERPSRL